MRELPLIENAFLCIENDLISDFGEMNSFIQKLLLRLEGWIMQ